MIEVTFERNRELYVLPDDQAESLASMLVVHADSPEHSTPGSRDVAREIEAVLVGESSERIILDDEEHAEAVYRTLDVSLLAWPGGPEAQRLAEAFKTDLPEHDPAHAA